MRILSRPMLIRACSSTTTRQKLLSSTRVRSTATNIRHHYSYASPGSYQDNLLELWKQRDFHTRGFTVGIGGPVGSGKTALVQALCRYFPTMGVVTNDIFTQEDAEFLMKHSNLPHSHVRAVETGGCPHSAIREDISMNVTALEELGKDLMLCESGGDNLAANFSRELADLTIYVIDVAGGDKVPRKGGPGITESDLLVINKIDLADAVGADLELMERQANGMRTKQNPVYMVSVKHKNGVDRIAEFIQTHHDKAMSL